MKKNILKIGLFLSIGILSLFPSLEMVSAQGKSINEAIKTLEINGAGNLPQQFVQFDKSAHTQQEDKKSLIGLFQKVLFGLTTVAGAIAVILTVVNGFRMVYSQGGDELGKAKEGLIWSSLGLLLILFAYIIVKTAISLTYIDGSSSGGGSGGGGTQQVAPPPPNNGQPGPIPAGAEFQSA